MRRETIPAPPAVLLEPFVMVKLCACGLRFDAHAWKLLPYVGEMDGEVEGQRLELRNCPCGLTVAVPLVALRAETRNRFLPFVFSWAYRGAVHLSEVLPEPCSHCHALAVVALPPSLREEQPDGTTHVCHPSAGGCNLGFSDGAQ